MYAPNDKERSARALRDTAEANRIQAEANQINDGLSSSKVKAFAKNTGIILGIFFLGWVLGIITME